jgi:uncharacterized protein YdaU (DUF1376 family)
MSGPGFPWLKWYPRDFASATRGWPLVARGLYHALLDAQWDIGGCTVGTLPDDEKQLQLIAAATPAEWRQAWPYVEPKFPQVPGGRRNARMEKHRAEGMREYEGRRKGAHITNQKLGRRGGANGVAARSPGESVSDS